MADKTGIEWTDATWNPILGCSRVSEGCRHCYAESVANRFCGPGQPYEGLVQIDPASGWDASARRCRAMATCSPSWPMPAAQGREVCLRIYILDYRRERNE